MTFPARLQQGASVGPYVIVQPIGAGAMGQVYRAHDPRLGRDVAIKVLAEVPDVDRLARFDREARATAVLAHPNIVTIFDVGLQDALPYLVSELLEGETLRTRLSAGPLEPREIVEMTLALARAMAAAHALRVVHRDLKPENLFITRDGTLKILDFGLAKLKPDAVAKPKTSPFDSTEPGTLLGTPAYMAPEQVRGEPVDERADIFAIGAILYEMVSGKSVFRKKSGAETLAAILHTEPPPLAAGSNLPPALGRLILHCLAKDPAERLPSARDLILALESILAEFDRPSEPRPTPVPRQDPQHLATARHPARPSDVGSPRPTSSVAVLPFADMSPTRDQDWLCEGIAEELINALAQIEGFRVASRSSSFQFRTQGADIQAVGARLGVAAVLEGSVRKVGDRLRITVQLVDVADGYQRWSQRFDRSTADVFTIQDEIAESVATAMRGILSLREKEALRRPETAVEAYEYFLRGRQLLHRWQRVAMEQSRAMFERAIEIDPGYAPAWAGLAHVHGSVYEWMGGGATDLSAADRASQKALELAPGLSGAHTARGLVLSLDRRYEEAGREFEEAIRLDPNSFDAHYVYARSRFACGDIEQSVDLFRRASELRPEDFQSAILLDQSLRMLGRVEEADKAGWEGIHRAERQLELDPRDIRALSLAGSALGKLGQTERGLRWTKRALELGPEDQAVLVNCACLRAQAGLKEEAIELLERVFSRGWGKRDWIEHDPDYDNLRDDPRFQAMLAKLR